MSAVSVRKEIHEARRLIRDADQAAGSGDYEGFAKATSIGHKVERQLINIEIMMQDAQRDPRRIIRMRRIQMAEMMKTADNFWEARNAPHVHEGEAYPIALGAAKELEIRNPEDSAILYRLVARMAFDRGELDTSRSFSAKALELYEKALETDPNNHILLLSATSAATEAGQIEKAKELYRRQSRVALEKLAKDDPRIQRSVEITQNASVEWKQKQNEKFEEAMNRDLGISHPTNSEQTFIQRVNLGGQVLGVLYSSSKILAEMGHIDTAFELKEKAAAIGDTEYRDNAVPIRDI